MLTLQDIFFEYLAFFKEGKKRSRSGQSYKNKYVVCGVVNSFPTALDILTILSGQLQLVPCTGTMTQDREAFVVSLFVTFLPLTNDNFG
jgi:hypothetical protein